jgi:hypothetical protein
MIGLCSRLEQKTSFAERVKEVEYVDARVNAALLQKKEVIRTRRGSKRY